MAKMTPDKARAIMAEWDRVDPIVHYQPGPTAKRFIYSKAPYRLIMANNQVGKTTALMYDCAAIFRNRHPNRKRTGPCRLLLLAPSRAQAKMIYTKRLLEACELKGDIGKYPFIPKREIAKIDYAYGGPMGKYAGCYTHNDGTELYVALSGDKNSWKRIEGVTFDYVWRDEADGNENLGDELSPRLLKAQSLRSAHPDNWWRGGMAWGFTKTKINDEATDFHELCKKLGAPEYEVFYPDAANQAENPAVSVQSRMDMASKMSAEAFAVRGIGDATAEDLLAILPEIDIKRHIVTNAAIRPQDNLWLTWDPGWRDAFGIGLWILRPENEYQLICHRWWQEKGRTIDYQTQLVAKYLKGRRLEGIIADPNANKSEYSRGVPVIQLFTEALCEQLKVKVERGVLFGRNRLEDTVPQLKRYLDPNPHDQSVTPLLVVQEDAAQFLSYLNNARFKPGAKKLAYNTIEGRSLEAFDTARYLVSRQPVWVKRPDNLVSAEYRDGDSSPTPQDIKPSSDDPFEILPGMSDDEITMRRRLKYSAEMITSMDMIQV